ncbi:MAG TPA: oligosaccharide flippase family protein, partial [Gemmatimonadales bacterium]|nr:oligosaccharide flippase family protein [Gemmatimonadales bacterium]
VPTAETATLLIACSLPFTAALTMFGAVFRGLLRFDYVALFGLLNGALYGVGAAILVAFGGRLRAVVGLYAGLMTASALVQWVVLRRLVPGIRIVPRLEGKTLRQLFGFGGFMLFNQVGQIALQQLDRLVISRVLSVAMTGYYAVPFNIGQRVGTLGAAAATVALPHSSGSVARGELGEFRRAYASSARFVAWLTLAPALVVIVFGDKLLTYWMSPEFAAHGTVALRLLAFGAFWMGVASLSAVSIEGAGRPWVTSAFTALTGGLNLAGLLLLTPRWGLGGAAASVTGSVLVLAALDVWYFSTRVVRTAMGEWVGSVVVPVFATTVLSLPLLLPLRAVMSTLSSVILVAGLAMGAVGVIGYRLFLSADERRRTRAQAAALWRRWTAPDATLPEEV